MPLAEAEPAWPDALELLEVPLALPEVPWSDWGMEDEEPELLGELLEPLLLCPLIDPLLELGLELLPEAAPL